jgi:long-chain acyl-CoA synthetase
MEWSLSYPDLSQHNTVPKLFWYNVENYSDDITTWWKQKGLWESVTWGQYGDWVRDIANALLSAGIKQGDKVSILSQTRFEWVVMDIAIMSIGGVTAPIYHSNTEDQVHYIAEHSRAKLVFAEDQEQLDKLLEIRGKLPEIKQIIIFDKYQPKDISNVKSLLTFREEGIKYSKENPDDLVDKISKGDPEDLISFIYTSGTTGHPKAGMINSRNVLAVVKHLKTMYGMSREDISIAYLPLAHIAERDLGHFMKLYIGNETIFAESLEDMPANLRQTGPTVMFGTPRVFEKFYARIATGIKDATSIQRILYKWALKVGQLFVETKDAGKSPSPFLWLKHKIAHFFIFRKIHDIFGGRIRFMISGAAPISPNIVHFFHWIGLDIYEVYGMTETTGIISANIMGKVKIASVGQIFPDTEVKIADDGEILCRGPQNIQGYYDNDEATAELLIIDEKNIEWLYTGDVGYLDEDGYLFITDRKKDLIITAAGKNVAPQNIENLLKTSSYVSQAMVYGDKKAYLTALITLDEDEIAKFARDRKILYQDLADLTKKKEIIDLIHHEVSTLNRELASYETIKKFYIPEEDFNQDKDELTPTMKIRRKVVTERYKDILENLYKAN